MLEQNPEAGAAGTFMKEQGTQCGRSQESNGGVFGHGVRGQMDPKACQTLGRLWPFL